MRNLLFLLLLFKYNHVAAVPRDSLRNKQDTTYIKHYEDKLITKLDLDNDYLRFKLTGDDFNMTYSPTWALTAPSLWVISGHTLLFHFFRFFL